MYEDESVGSSLMQNKPLLYAIGIIGAIVFMASVKKNNGGDVSTSGIDTSAHNDTLYIPTTENHYEYVYGNQTITDNHNVTSGVVIPPENNSPHAPTPSPSSPVTSPTPSPVQAKKTMVLTSTTSMYKNWSDANPVTNIAPQTVTVLSEGGGGGWVQISSSLGAMWIKPNQSKTVPSTNTTASKPSQPVPKPSKPAPVPSKPVSHTTTYTVKKGDTLTKIAKEYHSSISEIANKNHIANPNKIYAGQKLTI